MNLIICHHCKTAFSPSLSITKKCDCGLTTGNLREEKAFDDEIETIIFYSGDHAKAYYMVDPEELSPESIVFFINDEAVLISDPASTKLSSDRAFVEKVIDYLNDRAGTSYRVKHPSSNSKLILARRDEDKATIQDFYDVIDKKSAQWKNNDKMSIYLRPATLFNKTKFQNYLGERQATRTEPESNFDKFTSAADTAKRNIIERSK